MRKKIHGTAEPAPASPCSVPTSTSCCRSSTTTPAVTLASASSIEADIRAQGSGGTVEAATRLGTLVAERAKAAGIDKVVFDRGGFQYHGRVAAAAQAARDAGLEF